MVFHGNLRKNGKVPIKKLARKSSLVTIASEPLEFGYGFRPYILPNIIKTFPSNLNIFSGI